MLLAPMLLLCGFPVVVCPCMLKLGLVCRVSCRLATKTGAPTQAKHASLPAC